MAQPEPHLRFLRPRETSQLVWLPPSQKILLPAALTGAAEYFGVALSDASPFTELYHAAQGDRYLVEEPWHPSPAFGGLFRELRYAAAAAEDRTFLRITEEQSFRAVEPGALEANGLPEGNPVAVWDRRITVLGDDGDDAGPVLVLRASVHRSPGSPARLWTRNSATALSEDPEGVADALRVAAADATLIHNLVPHALAKWISGLGVQEEAEEDAPNPEHRGLIAQLWMAGKGMVAGGNRQDRSRADADTLVRACLKRPLTVPMAARAAQQVSAVVAGFEADAAPVAAEDPEGTSPVAVALDFEDELGEELGLRSSIFNVGVGGDDDIFRRSSDSHVASGANPQPLASAHPDVAQQAATARAMRLRPTMVEADGAFLRAMVAPGGQTGLARLLRERWYAWARLARTSSPRRSSIALQAPPGPGGRARAVFRDSQLGLDMRVYGGTGGVGPMRKARLWLCGVAPDLATEALALRFRCQVPFLDKHDAIVDEILGARIRWEGVDFEEPHSDVPDLKAALKGKWRPGRRARHTARRTTSLGVDRDARSASPPSRPDSPRGWYPGKYAKAAAHHAPRMSGHPGRSNSSVGRSMPMEVADRKAGEPGADDEARDMGASHGGSQEFFEVPVELEGPALGSSVSTRLPVAFFCHSVGYVGEDQAEALQLAQLRDMGFGALPAAAALWLCGRRTEDALDLLLRAAQGDEAGVLEAAAAHAPKKHPENRGMDLGLGLGYDGERVALGTALAAQDEETIRSFLLRRRILGEVRRERPDAPLVLDSSAALQLRYWSRTRFAWRDLDGSASMEARETQGGMVHQRDMLRRKPRLFLQLAGEAIAVTSNAASFRFRRDNLDALLTLGPSGEPRPSVAGVLRRQQLRGRNTVPDQENRGAEKEERPPRPVDAFITSLCPALVTHMNQVALGDLHPDDALNLMRVLPRPLSLTLEPKPLPEAAPASAVQITEDLLLRCLLHPNASELRRVLDASLQGLEDHAAAKVKAEKALPLTATPLLQTEEPPAGGGPSPHDMVSSVLRWAVRQLHPRVDQAEIAGGNGAPKQLNGLGGLGGAVVGLPAPPPASPELATSASADAKLRPAGDTLSPLTLLLPTKEPLGPLQWAQVAQGLETLLSRRLFAALLSLSPHRRAAGIALAEALDVLSPCLSLEDFRGNPRDAVARLLRGAVNGVTARDFLASKARGHWRVPIAVIRRHLPAARDLPTLRKVCQRVVALVTYCLQVDAVQARRENGGQGAEVVGADDMVPALAFVLAVANPKQLLERSWAVQHFRAGDWLVGCEPSDETGSTGDTGGDEEDRVGEEAYACTLVATAAAAVRQMAGLFAEHRATNEGRWQLWEDLRMTVAEAVQKAEKGETFECLDALDRATTQRAAFLGRDEDAEDAAAPEALDGALGMGEGLRHSVLAAAIAQRAGAGNGEGMALAAAILGSLKTRPWIAGSVSAGVRLLDFGTDRYSSVLTRQGAGNKAPYAGFLATPLHLAAARCDPVVVATLLRNGADRYAVDGAGFLPLDVVPLDVSNGAPRNVLETVALLCADPTGKEETRESRSVPPLRLNRVCVAGNVFLLEALLMQGVNANQNPVALGGEEVLPLGEAVAAGSIDCVSALLSHRALPDQVFPVARERTGEGQGNAGATSAMALALRSCLEYDPGMAAASGYTRDPFAVVAALLNAGSDRHAAKVLFGLLRGETRGSARHRMSIRKVEALLAYNPKTHDLPSVARAGDPVGVWALLAHCVDPNARHETLGYTPLIAAVHLHDMKVADMLLRNPKTDVNAGGRGGVRPLHYAAMNGHLDMLLLLLKKGADRTVKDEQGRTPGTCVDIMLDVAEKRLARAKSGETATDARAGAHDPLANSGATAIHASPGGAAAPITADVAGMEAKIDALRQVLSVLTYDAQTHSLIFYCATAVSRPNLSAVDALLLQGVDPNLRRLRRSKAVPSAAAKAAGAASAPSQPAQPQSQPWLFHLSTPLITGAACRQAEAIQRLLVAPRIRVDQTNVLGQTPLMYAAGAGALSILLQLLKAGADRTLQDTDGRTAQDWASRHNKTKCWAVLKFNPGRLSPAEAALRADVEALRALLDQMLPGAVDSTYALAHLSQSSAVPADAEEQGGGAAAAAPLVAFVTRYRGFLEVHEHAVPPELWHWSPLGCAVLASEGSILGYLLDVGGADPNAVAGPHDMSALHLAALTGDRLAIAELLRRGASRDRADDLGLKPVDLVWEGGEGGGGSPLASGGRKKFWDGKSPPNVVFCRALLDTAPNPPGVLSMAAGLGDLVVVEALLRGGAGWQDGEEEPPIVAACRVGPKGRMAPTLRLLIPQLQRDFPGPKKPLDAKNAGGETALMHAAARGAKDAVTLLLREGASALVTDAEGYTAEHWARKAKCTIRGESLVGLGELAAALQQS